MVAEGRPRKSLGLGARLICPLLRPPQRSRARLDGIEQRPVALPQRVPLRERRAQFEAERAQHAVVAVVALQNNADQRCRRGPAGGAELVGDRIAFGEVEFGQRPAGQTREMIERLLHQRCITAERRQHVGLNRGIVGAWNLVLVAGGNDHRGDGAEVVALG